MRNLGGVVALTLCLAGAATAPAFGAGPKPPAIPDPSDWEVTITYRPGASQKAAIRFRNGVIYPAINNVKSGTMFLDRSGKLHILFDGHPKVSRGEAILERPAKGTWKGVLDQPTGRAMIVLKRK